MGLVPYDAQSKTVLHTTSALGMGGEATHSKVASQKVWAEVSLHTQKPQSRKRSCPFPAEHFLVTCLAQEFSWWWHWGCCSELKGVMLHLRHWRSIVVEVARALTCHNPRGTTLSLSSFLNCDCNHALHSSSYRRLDWGRGGPTLLPNYHLKYPPWLAVLGGSLIKRLWLHLGSPIGGLDDHSAAPALVKGFPLEGVRKENG